MQGDLALAEFGGLLGDKEADNEAKETKDRAENLDDEHLDEQRAVSGISKSGATAVDSYSNTTDEVAHPNSDTRPEQREASVVRIGGEELGTRNGVDLGGEDNGHNDTVDGDDFAEDNGDQVLGANTGCLNTSTEDGGTSDEDAPCCTDDGEANTQRNTQTGPGVGRHRFEESSDIERFATAGEEHISSRNSQE